MLVDMWKRGMALGIIGWLAVAAGAVTVGILAVTLVGAGLTSGSNQPLSSDGVSRALAQTTTQPSSTRRSASPSASPSAFPSASSSAANGPTVALPSDGGTVYARCSNGQAYLTSWTPHTGFETEEVERGPDRHASVRFDGDDRELKVVVSCKNGRPTAEIEDKTD